MSAKVRTCRQLSFNEYFRHRQFSFTECFRCRPFSFTEYFRHRQFSFTECFRCRKFSFIEYSRHRQFSFTECFRCRPFSLKLNFSRFSFRWDLIFWEFEHMNRFEISLCFPDQWRYTIFEFECCIPLPTRHTNYLKHVFTLPRLQRKWAEVARAVFYSPNDACAEHWFLDFEKMLTFNHVAMRR